MALGRVAAPVDDEVRSILDLAQRAGDFATQLGGDFGWTVSEAGVTVDHASNQFGERHRLSRGLAGDVAQPVNQRQVRVIQTLGGDLDGLNVTLKRVERFWIDQVRFRL